MNHTYLLVANILNEKLFSRHTFFNPMKMKERADKQRMLLAQQRSKKMASPAPIQKPEGITHA